MQKESPPRYTLKEGDAFHELDSIQNETAHLIITSPPYNIGKIYERDKSMDLAAYIKWLSGIIEKLIAKVVPHGSICWQTGNYIKNNEVFLLDIHFYNIFKKFGLKLRNRIVWHFNFGLNATQRLSGRYETILWFSKSDSFTFNLDSVRVPQLYPGKRHSNKKGTKAGQPSGNPKGKNPSDFWEFSPRSLFIEEPIWDIPNVKSKHPEKTIHPCQFPVELAERCVLALTSPGDIVLDPFVGTGSSMIAALKHNRHAIGIDNSKQYIGLTEKRIKEFYDGKLSLRPAGKSVRRPKPTEKVAQTPKEWLNNN